MNTKYFFVAPLVVFAFVAVSVAAFSLPNTEEISERVIAHTDEEVKKALNSGCVLVKDINALKALKCPEAVANALGLQEDIKVFALDVDTASASANTQISANTIHVAGNTGAGRKIAVLDTGYNYNHPELSSSYLGGKDFVNNDDDPSDDNGHGSHVAGTITADGVNANAKGVAPDADILVAKVLDENGSGYFSDVVEAIYWVVNGNDGVYGTADDFDVDAISLSLGTGAPLLYKSYCDTKMLDLTYAIRHATTKNIPVIVAAGNSGTRGVSIPGCISYATTVGAVSSTDKIASFSGRGVPVDIVAPGVSIYSSISGSGYASWSGTSMATPMISGVVALMKYAHPTYSQSQVESKLFTTAKDLGLYGLDKNYGWGRVRADLAVK